MLKGQRKNTPYKKIALKCKHCGKLHNCYYYRIKSFRYCSNKCKNAALKNRIPWNKIKLSEQILCSCKNPACNKQIKLVPHLARKFKYCSRQCRDKTFQLLKFDTLANEFLASIGIANQSVNLLEKDMRVWILNNP